MGVFSFQPDQQPDLADFPKPGTDKCGQAGRELSSTGHPVLAGIATTVGTHFFSSFLKYNRTILVYDPGQSVAWKPTWPHKVAF